jgi:predicted amidohydrolase YtcJ
VISLVPGISGDSVWWQDGRIKAIGPAAELERKVPTRVPRFDLPQAIVTPGFVDGHTHFGMWARSRRRVHLAGAATREEALQRVAAGVPDQGWILGHGWDANRWPQAPDRWSLDQITSLPTFLDSIDIHAGWANSAALLAAGIDRDTPDPPGGRIVRDGSGESTGLLLERAALLISERVPAPSAEDLVRLMSECQDEAHRMGLTGIHDVEGADALRAFRSLEAEDRLTLRVLFSPPVAQLPALVANGVRSGQGSDRLTLGGVKMFLDGSLGTRTAWMLEAYEDGRDSGMPLATEAEARRAVEEASSHGLACVIHAIGDAAVRRALDLLEQAPGTGMPHRVEHFQCVASEDLARAGRAGIIASMQPGHLPGDVLLAEERWGRRTQGAYPFRSLLQRGTVLAFGSDVPVVSLDPRNGVVAAMARVAADGSFEGGWHPGERLTFEDAVRAYTEGNAIAGGAADRRGTLVPGRDADLVAWGVDHSILENDASAFREAAVELTVIGGAVVYRRE